MKNNKIKLNYTITLFISLLFIESIFRLIAFDTIDLGIILRIISFDLGLSLLLTVFAYNKNAKKFLILFILLFSIYGFVQLQFKNFLDNYYSFAAASDGIGRIKDYIVYFIKDAKAIYYLCLIPGILALTLTKVYEIKKTNNIIVPIISGILALGLSIIALPIGNTAIDIKTTYNQFNNNELLLNKIGLYHFLFKDFDTLIYGKDEVINLEVDVNPVLTPDTNVEVQETDFNRYIDDTQLLNDYNNETNNTLKTIDNYFLNKSVASKNEYTGIFEDYNFIYVLVESFDYMAIDKDLTPTLYKMMSEGMNFSNHYTPKYSCTTGESEYIAMTSIIPYNNLCTPNVVSSNTYPQALPMLFKNAGYDTYSFHNWYDQYYDRRIEHKSFGIDVYYDIYDLNIKEIQGWQSDLTLVEKAYPIFKDSDRFFSFIISSSMHWPYDQNSTLGDRYMKEINEIHPDYPIDIKRYISKSMEFDKSMEYLITSLENDNKLDNTIICLFSDHHPFKLSNSIIDKYSPLMDRSDLYGTDKTPFIIYNPNITSQTITNVNSTFDNTPTIANLFNLNYDPRLYIGSDLFNNNTLVIYPNSDWINKDGVYTISNNTFTPFSDAVYTDEMIAANNKIVSNNYILSYSIMDNNYFKYRDYLGNPKIKEGSN